MPKKPARNGFWYFMRDWKEREESRGRTFPNGFTDVQSDPQCSEAWKALGPEHKARYTARAKKGKMESRDNAGKLTGTGESVAHIKEEADREQEFNLTMSAHIRHIVFDSKKYNALPTTKFLFLHMNTYYMREPDNEPVDFCPAEFAIAEFCLEEGVTRYYHEIIRTPLHLGYAREAMETSQNSHKLHWDLSVGEGNWATMYTRMMEFIAPNKVHDKLPPIYTSVKILHIIPSLLRRLTEPIPGMEPGMFLIYTVEALFGTMVRAVSEFADGNIVGTIAQTQFHKERFAYTPNIECDFHKTHDGTSQFCSLSIVRQWAYTFCDHCNQPLGLVLAPGVHCPETPEMLRNDSRLMNSSMRSSMNASYAPSVLSATGVSNDHRIRVSERNRDEERRRRNAPLTVEIIQHSPSQDDRPKPPVEPVAYAAVPAPTRPLRTPNTMCAAMKGHTREVPPLDGLNFPVIGGRGKPMKTESPGPGRTQAEIWNHRRAKDENDSD